MSNTNGPACARTKETRSSEALVREFEHRVGFFVGKVTRRFMLGSRWRDEFESAGYWGLAKALDNLREDACNREISAYVSKRIEGAILDEARRCLDRTRLVDVPGGGGGSHDDGGDLDDTVLPFAGHLADPGATPEEIVGEHRLRDRVFDALETVEPEDHVLLHAYMGGSSLAEIARQEGLPTATVQVRFDRLMRRLRSRGSPLRGLYFHVGG